MTKTITLREANQTFSACVRAVEAGEEYVITRNGLPVARLAPVVRGRRVLTQAQREAWARIQARMETGWSLGGERFDRDSVYDR